MLIIRLAFFSLLMSVAIFYAGGHAYAAEDEFLEEKIVETVPTAEDDGYVPPTVENLSKLYWAIGKLDIKDDKMIDYFLMINECPLYLQYYHNDFEWRKIQEATRQYILNNMDEFPTRFEIMAPLALGRYNLDKEEFEVEHEYRISGLRRLDFAMNQEGYKETCTKKGDIYEYPDNIVIILNRPLVMEKVPVKRELAKLYIEDAKRFYEALPAEYQMKKYERMAFLRLKIRITQYKNTTKLTGGQLRAVVFGRLEGYEVYADADKLKPIYIKNIQGRRFRRLRRDPQENVASKDESAKEKQAESVQN